MNSKPKISDIEALAPFLASQWHPTLNRGILPSQVRGSSTRWVWWLGPCGHEWQESPSKRVRKGLGCPVCTGERTRPGVNDLATTDPDLADAWTRAGRHDRHFDLSADDLNPRSPWLIAWLNRDQDDVDQATTSDGR